MNKKIARLFGLLLVIGALFLQNGFAQSVDMNEIQKLTAVFKTNEKAKIASCFRFPIERDYPLDAIESKEQLIAKFDEVLDESFIKQIASANTADDWSIVGWRGIMFKNGMLWLDDEYQITAVNYETAKGKQALATAIAKDKDTLPKNKRVFQSPVAKWTVDGSVYRVDQVSNESYRLLILTAKNKVALELNNGTSNADGSGGNCYYKWTDKKKNVHVVYIDCMQDSAFYAVMKDADFDQATISDHVVKVLAE